MVTKYLFNEDEMLARLFAGFLHPAIQLMCGLEWYRFFSLAILVEVMMRANLKVLSGIKNPS